MSSLLVTKVQENKSFTTLINCINQIADPRIQRGKKHLLVNVIIMALCAALGGANNWVEIEQFAWNHCEWFDSFLDLSQKPGIPSHDTFSRVFSLIKPDEFIDWIELWLGSIVDTSLPATLIRIDGKMLKSLSAKDAMYFVRAWSEENKLVLCQVKVKNGTNEITTIPDVLRRLDLRGKIVTIDAIGAQKHIVKMIKEGGGDYVITLKKNQHDFYTNVSLYLQDIAAGELSDNSISYARTIEKDHGRNELRECWVTTNIGWLHNRHFWRGLRSVALIRSTVTKNGTTSIHERCFISSLFVQAPRILSIVRGHWTIENQLHWRLDVVFDEDRSTTRDIFSMQNLAFLRGAALSLLLQKDISLSTKGRRTRCANSFPFLVETLLNTAF